MTSKPTYFTARGQGTSTLDREPHTIYLHGTSTPSVPVDVFAIAYEEGDPPPPLLDAACIREPVLDAIEIMLRGETTRSIDAIVHDSYKRAFEEYAATFKIGSKRLRLLVELCDMLDAPGTKIDDAAVREKMTEFRNAKEASDAGR